MDTELDFDWKGFVHSVKSPMLLEQLKRLSVGNLAYLDYARSKGMIEIFGPQFTVEYLTRRENLVKFTSALTNFTGIENWTVKGTVFGVGR